MKAFYSDKFAVDIGEHIMPMQKFGHVRRQLLSLGLSIDLCEPEPLNLEQLQRVHTQAYIDAIRTGHPQELAQSQKFPWSEALFDSVCSTGGACLSACVAALGEGVAAALCSGFHHAHSDHGQGFCTFNSLVVALEELKELGKIRRALILDLDLHYGNGTVSLLAHRPHLFNMSIYGAWYENNQSTTDVESSSAKDTANCRSIALPNGMSGEDFLPPLARWIEEAVRWAQPDLILYQAGADPFCEDPYSPLQFTAADLFHRDRIVFETAREHGIPIAWVLAGGYTEDIAKVVGIHTGTFRAAHEVFGK
jgi:acetoin utilization deacetylase AcuC-like enzyme